MDANKDDEDDLILPVPHELGIDVRDAHEDLNKALTAFTRAYAADWAYPAWVQGIVGDNAAHRAAALKALTTWEYFDGQPPEKTLILPGMVGASDATLGTAAKLNTTKVAFKMAIEAVRADLRQQLKANIRPNASGVRPDYQYTEQKTIRKVLGELWRGRANLLQIYRLIHAADAPVSRVAFGWAAREHVEYHTTPDAIRVKLIELNREERIAPSEAQRVRDLLAALAHDDTLVLRVPKDPYPVVSLYQISGKRLKQQRASQPVLIPSTPSAALPEIRALPDKPLVASRRSRNRDLELVSKALGLYRRKSDSNRTAA